MDNRAIIARVRSELVAAGNQMIGDAVASQGTLILATTLTGSFASVKFNVLENVGTTLNIERRLKINDMFTITHWGLQLIKAGTTTAATQSEISSAKRYANPNALVFTGVGESAALMNLWTGTLEVTVDRKIILQDYDCMRFYRVGQAQKGVGPAVITTDDEWQTPNYGMDFVDPQVTLSGGGTPEINLVLPNSQTLTGTASTNVLVLVARGIKWQGASKLNA